MADAMGEKEEINQGSNMNEPTMPPTEDGTPTLNVDADEDQATASDPLANIQTPEDVQEATPTPNATPVQDYVSHLNGINNLEITEFNQQTYKFCKVKDPNGEYTDKFEVFTRPVGSATWDILNGLLTERYSVARLEPFVESLSNSINLIGTPSARIDGFKSMWVGGLQSPINLWDDESAKLVFALITGTPIEAIDNITTKLNVMVVNSYDGKGKLRIDYALKTTAQANGSSQEFHDYFSLVKFSSKVIHGQNLENVSADINTIMTNIQATVDVLKTISIEENDLVEKIAQRMPSDGKNALMSIWETMVPDIKNMYYLAIVSSIVLDKYWSLTGYTNARTVLEKAIQSATEEQS